MWENSEAKLIKLIAAVFDVVEVFEFECAVRKFSLLFLSIPNLLSIKPLLNLKNAIFPLLLSGITILFSSCNQNAPDIEWQKCYGGSLRDEARSISPTFDGGFIVTGYIGSFDGDAKGNHGFNDLWILKLDQSGNMQWTKTYGGSYFDEGKKILQTANHDYIVIANTYSIDGDVQDNHGASDGWILRLDSLGNIKWNKTWGTMYLDFFNDVLLTRDGGFVVCGEQGFNDDTIYAPVKNQDATIVKFDSLGNIQWEKTLRGSGQENAVHILQSSDGSFALLCESNSRDGDFTENHSDQEDIALFKLRADGTIQWKKIYGGSGQEIASSVEKTSDGGYFISGTSNSSDGDIYGNHGFTDFITIKTDSNGNIQWQKSYGGFLEDQAVCMLQTKDEGYLLSGFTSSVGGMVKANHGLSDIWIIKLDESGNILWQKSIGGSGNDTSEWIVPANNGGYLLAATTDSNDGDVHGNHGKYDCWLVKLKGK